jgi:hypothetical protein
MSQHTTLRAAGADFAPTEILFRNGDVDEWDNGFAPTQVLVQELHAAEPDPAYRGVVLTRPTSPAPWLGRWEAMLDQLMPGAFGSLLGLFLCVAMSIVLISAMLPLVDHA